MSAIVVTVNQSINNNQVIDHYPTEWDTVAIRATFQNSPSLTKRKKE